MVFNIIKRSLRILSSPKKEFEDLNKRTFESVVGDYTTLLVTVAILAGLLSLIYSVARAVYFDMFLDISIQYVRMINYSIGRSTSLLFFYLFAGTFLLFFLSMVLRPFLKRMKYTSLLKILFYSLTPLLLFSWFLFNPLPLGIWSLFLLITGIKTYKIEHIKKNSIKKRD
ncbi:MAG: YIP1 family protein [Nanoarchaeota archaeon]|nr:YIP1 family protein [Nanoarchaeota archaeon]